MKMVKNLSEMMIHADFTRKIFLDFANVCTCVLFIVHVNMQ